MRRLRRRPAVAVGWLVAGMLASVAGCGRAAVGGSDEGSGTAAATVGRASVGYPDDWVVLTAGGRPQGWDWAAQDRAGDAGTAQLALDGDYSALDVDLSTAQLLAAAQVGGYPDFAVQTQKPVTVSGAQRAVEVDFGYRGGAGGRTPYQGVWLVAQAAGSHTVVLQLSGQSPLDGTLVKGTLDRLEVR